jgi:hypothetical protein
VIVLANLDGTAMVSAEDRAVAPAVNTGPAGLYDHYRPAS